ncbi:putative tat pathway signal sequence protein [Diplogelasinospora grovesii]|uniref:Tat pathway signal sequence protein n=1 Tax=Diplogelasinospora grovesii TaxID=303347 RepID=A0AAN6N8K6_9PEZI|nr:putative tat pathway signal sequence protein [Diplogelasinospora grovesii]
MNSSSYAAQNGSANGTHTVTAIGRWSILNKQPPAVEKITAIHVYDFDNTLFKTPLPNPKIWNGPTIGTLANPEAFVNGGWWHDSRILAATGEGLEKEEPKAWSGWWNEKIVELIQLSMEQKDALCVLLTGRSEAGFSDLIKRMVVAKGLEFDLITLKPAVGPDNQRFASTMIFKQMFLEALMETYRRAEEIRIYEDRPKHVKGFRDFLADYNKRQNGIGGRPTRGPITAEVIQVADMATNLDPVAEVAEVQHLINEHNAALAERRGGLRGERLMIKKTVFFTGYMLNSTDTQRLLTLARIPSNLSDTDLKYHANNIMICPRPCPASILDKVGGMGSKMKWEVTGTACFENSIWAACLKPVPPTAKFHTDNPSPLVVLALRKGARPVDAGKIQNWQPVPPDQVFVFETTVSEKVLLRIEAEDANEGDYESLFPHKNFRRKHTGDEDFRSRQSNGQSPRGGHRNERHFHQSGYNGRGGGNQGRFRGGANPTPNRGFRGGRGGGGSRGRGGRGGGHHYRSLDDVMKRETQGQVSYEDDSRRSYQKAQQQQQNPTNHSHCPPQQQYQAPSQQSFYQQSQQPQQPQQHQHQHYGSWPSQHGMSGIPGIPGITPQPARPVGGATGYGTNGSGLNNYC